jgi:hypothetical protein
MQQLEIEHKEITATSNQIVGEQQENKTKDRREGKGRAITLSRMVYRLQNSDVYYVESETCNNIYYFVKYVFDVLEFCSCKDYESKRTEKGKHLHAVEYSLWFGTMKDMDKLPVEAKRDNTIYAKSHLEDDYSF